MKKLLVIVAGAAGFAVLAAFVYAAFVIAQAGNDTPEILRREFVPERIAMTAAELTPWQREALLMVEDPGFYAHKGVDLNTPGGGLTTITQGLVKFLYFDPFKPGFAKVKQTLIARYVLNGALSKEDQLTLFINRINLGSIDGRPVHGFRDAAAAYYGKTVSELSEDEYLSIVAMIIAPKNFHLAERPAANAERTRRLKAVVSGAYRPKGLMDIYYGTLDEETQKGLAPASYFPRQYERE